MLVAKLRLYFESAKKTGEKFQKKLGFQKHCTPPCHPHNRHQGTMKGLYATCSSWHIAPSTLNIQQALTFSVTFPRNPLQI